MQSKEKDKKLLITEPSQTRLVFAWVELAVIEILLLTFWIILEKKIKWQLIVLVVIFLTLFAAVATVLSFLYRKNNSYTFTTTKIIARAGITQVFRRSILYSEIVFYKKMLGLPDLLNKKQTANFIFYRIETAKNGKRKLKKDAICSMRGIKRHNEISEILKQNQVQELTTIAQKTKIKKELKQEWKTKKQNQK